VSNEADIARLEARMDNLERDIKEIKDEQSQTRSIAVTIATLNAQLGEHLKAHEKIDKRRFSTVELVLVGIQAIAAVAVIVIK